ncbi:MAG TPA: DUF4434 domain-containing protein [Clostridiaceae bacterium]
MFKVRRLAALVLALPLIFMSLSIPSKAFAAPSAAITSYRVPCGSFVQYYMTQSWTDARWQQELKSMKKAGMKYLIFSPSVSVDETSGITSAIYPTNLPEFKKGYIGVDCTDAVLRNCQKAGMKVFIALNIGSKFWNFGWNISGTQPDAYTAYWRNNARISNEVASELYSMYKSKYPDAFYGWYWVQEFWNYTICTNTYEGNCPASSPDSWAKDPKVYTDIIAKEAFSPVLDHLTQLDLSMPMMLSPFANQTLCKASSNARFWGDIIRNTRFRPGDIMAPQDSIGAHGVTIENLDAWTSSYKTGVDANSNLHLWSNNETFLDNGESTLLDRLVQQISITSKYAEQNITFTWNHYYSPYNTLKGFNETYMSYVKTGMIEKNPPHSVNVSSIKSSKLSDGTYKISWHAPKDDTGIAVYNIYKGSTLVSHIYATRRDMTNTDPTLNTFCTMKEGGVYTIEAIDFAGNKSSMTSFSVL